MTNQERYAYYNSGVLQPMVQIELIDWLSYWTTAGTERIEDDLLRAQTEQAINDLMFDLNGMTNKVSMLAIGEDVIRSAQDEPTPEQIATAVTNIMTYKLRWLTGVTEVVTE